MPNDLKHTEASFLPILTDSLFLRVAQMPIISGSGDFFLLTTTTLTDIQTDHYIFLKGNGVMVAILYYRTVGLSYDN